MTAQELVALAEQLLVICAELVEEVHPELVAGGERAELAKARVNAVVMCSERLNALARCAAVLLEFAAAEEIAA